MSKLDLLNFKVIPTDCIGSLTIMWILIEYDYPRCFIAKSNNGNYYALNEIEDKPDKFGWAVTEVTMGAIELVDEGKNNIQALFRNKKNKYLLFFENNDEIGKATKVDAFEEKYKAKGDLYVKDFIGLKNHKCLSCPYIKLSKDFGSCYCGLIMTRIRFKNDLYHFCPLINIATKELMSPSLNKDCYCLLNDGRIAFIQDCAFNFYDDKIGEYKYSAYDVTDVDVLREMITIKHSDIVKVMNREEYRKKIKMLKDIKNVVKEK